MICPKCKLSLVRQDNTYKCANNHSYDVSKEGYVNLLLSRSFAGDSIESLKSRKCFLEKGYYSKLLYSLIEILQRYNIKSLCDCGCGVGYYTSYFSKFFETVGQDISKDAIKIAQRNNKQCSYIVASNYQIPFENNTFDCTIHIFSPIFSKEDYRILNNNGLLVLVTPAKNHMYELKCELYDKPYFNEVKAKDFFNFTFQEKLNINYKVDLDNKDIKSLIEMTPYFYKTDKSKLEKLNEINKLTITCDFDISIYKKQ